MEKTKILLVDDKQENIEALRVILEDLNLNIISCNSGNEAVALALKYDFAMILLDVQMPGMDGFETLQFIRKEEKNRKIPTLFLSAVYTSEVFKMKGIATGAVDFIVKPLDPDILIGKIKVFLELHSYAQDTIKTNSILSATLEATADGIMVMDNNSEIIITNSPFVNMWEIKQDVVRNLNSDMIKKIIIDRVVGPADFKERLNVNYSYLGQNNFEIIELTNGKIFKLIARPQLLENEKNGMVFNFSDLTKEKVLEKQIEEYHYEMSLSNAKMEERVFQTAFLNTKLTETQKQLVQLNANKDRFFSIISHDLKSPFSGLLGSVRMLDEDYETLSEPEKRQSISAISHISENIYNLLEGLLEWSRTQTGAIQFEPISFNLNYITSKIIEFLSQLAAKKNITLINNVPKDFFISADMNMIKTILRNLGTNAIKFSHENSVVEFYAEISDENILISVIDSGIGISEEDKKKIFRIDVHHSTIGTSKERGTGVGLILTKEFVAKHNGKIWIESELGVGSKFIFSIPKIIDVVNEADIANFNDN